MSTPAPLLNREEAEMGVEDIPKYAELIGKAGFTESDCEDLAQDMKLDLWQRLSKFDPSKAPLKAFTDRVVRHKVASIIEGRRAQRRDCRRQCSLNASLQDADHKSTERGDTIDQGQVYRRTGPPSHPLEDLRDLEVDVDHVLPRLPPRLRDICRRLRAKTPTEVSQETGIPRGSLYAAIEELRRRFKDAGLQKYL
jgi:RNA polymerase sigma-70 factor (ECF subfamily)